MTSGLSPETVHKKNLASRKEARFGLLDKMDDEIHKATSGLR
jgi:hypothetical protein